MSQYRGHPIALADGSWRYEDGVPVSKDKDRPCGHCGLTNTPEGHDGCLGTIPGAMNACCGHGVEREAYIQFPDGSRLSGAEALSRMRPRCTVRLIPPHRPWFKVAINAVLRFFQTRRRPARLLVVFSRFDAAGDLVGYGLGRVLHLAEPDERTWTLSTRRPT